MRALFLLALLAPAAAIAAQRDPLAGLKPSGKPVDCIQTRFYGRTDFIGRTGIVFSDGLGRAYLNTLPDACAILSRNAAIASRTPQDQLCRGDIIQVFDPVAHIPLGACGLGSFQPYAR